eukprot:2540829-Prymnesium_polylepis.1
MYSTPALGPRRRHLEPWATTYRAAAQEQQQLQLMHDLRRSSSCQRRWSSLRRSRKSASRS